MAINRICTSQEQSQKLIKLGIDVNTADMYWLNRHIDLTETKYELFVVDKSNEHIDFFNSYAVAVEKSEIIPAWSLTTLFKMLPYSARLERGSSTELYCVTLPNELKSSDWYIEPIDAVFEMVYWLKENGKL